ncbi:hypothetical protein Vretimale_17480 [Volvox reticuliferus]|uniref:Transmembrane protein n=1 Tax=Volvox reticuliferus TaxID=1737510 RepID=A0A8J4GV85_9CHLO|nr:hypothetical protein Vretifemale_18210 [Volvox reticuliferus]GIM14567.1 hypothetical protein Vretimale_17480 [Volvox reticuliferus]
MSDDNSSATPGKSRWQGKLESFFWTSAAVGVVLYGTGQHDLLTVLLFDNRPHRLFVWFGFFSAISNAIMFLYVHAWLGYFKGIKNPMSSGTLAVPAGAATFAMTIISFIIAFWPIFGIIAIVQVVVITYGIVSAMTFLPGVGPLKVEGKGS